MLLHYAYTTQLITRNNAEEELAVRRTPDWLRGARLFFAVLVLFTIAYQSWVTSLGPNYNPINSFSFFTIQCNLFAAVVLLWGALRSPAQPPTPTRDLVRGAAVLYLSVTGVVYGLLLSDLGAELQITLPWADRILHKIMPLVMVCDWLIAPPLTPIPLRRALVWLLYPLVYCLCSLIRGPLVGWYPYPFFNPARFGGYGGVALACVAIALGALVCTWLVVQAGNRLRLVARRA